MSCSVAFRRGASLECHITVLVQKLGGKRYSSLCSQSDGKCLWQNLSRDSSISHVTTWQIRWNDVTAGASVLLLEKVPSWRRQRTITCHGNRWKVPRSWQKLEEPGGGSPQLRTPEQFAGFLPRPQQARQGACLVEMVNSSRQRVRAARRLSALRALMQIVKTFPASDLSTQPIHLFYNLL